AEIGDRYERQEDGRLVKTESATLKQGMTECVSPTIGDIHKVSNALTDQVSISIHVYGADIGKVRCHVFNAETGEVKEIISGYANYPYAAPVRLRCRHEIQTLPSWYIAC